MHRSGLVFAALLVVPLAAPAAGLGRLAVMSRVGEPLNTEIEVTSLQGNEGESLAARVASPDVYRSAHVAPLPPVESLRAAIERKADGRPVVRVTSTEPVDKPVVNLLIELSWAGGTSIVRQYSFLLGGEGKPPPAASAPKVDAPVQAPAPAAEAARAPAIADAGGPYAVQSGDSLLKIAQATRYDGVTFAQMVVAIYRANEDAFIGSDMNRLKSGRTLAIPGRDVVAAVNADEAGQLVAAQRGQPEPVRGRPGAARPLGPEGDDAAARDRALAESRDRAAALEKTRDDLKQLIEARDREIADLERQLGGKSAGKSQPIRKPAP